MKDVGRRVNEDTGLHGRGARAVLTPCSGDFIVAQVERDGMTARNDLHLPTAGLAVAMGEMHNLHLSM